MEKEEIMAALLCIVNMSKHGQINCFNCKDANFCRDVRTIMIQYIAKEPTTKKDPRQLSLTKATTKKT